MTLELNHFSDPSAVNDDGPQHLGNDREPVSRTGAGMFVNPWCCRVADLVARDLNRTRLELIQELVSSFITEGQLQPILCRRIQPGADGAVFEVILGVRRLLTAQWLCENGHPEFKVWLDIIDLCDRDAFIAMDRENAAHATLSAWERARSMRRALKSDLFKNQRELAQALKERPATVSTLVRLAEWPSDLVAAFSSPFEILMVDAERLAPLIDDESRNGALLTEARRIKDERLSRIHEGKPPRTRLAVFNALKRSVRPTAPFPSNDCTWASVRKLSDGTRNLVISIRLPNKNVSRTLSQVRSHLLNAQKIELLNEPQEAIIEPTHPLIDFIESNQRTVSSPVTTS